MHFTASGIEVNPFVPPLVAFVVSFVTSMGGVSGAFLLLPFQMSVLGHTAPSVSATNQLFNVVAIPPAVLRYIREGRMVWPVTSVVILGTLPGVLLGAVVRVKWLPDSTSFKLFAACVLLWIGGKLVLELIRKHGTEHQVAEARFRHLVREHSRKSGYGEEIPAVRTLRFSASRVSYEFYGEAYDCSSAGLLALSLVVGVVGGIYGIGGGAIIAAFLVAIFRLPIHTVAGAALAGTFVTSVAGVLFYQCIAPFYPYMSVGPDWALGALFGVGGMAGMYLGARCQKYFPAKVIKWILAGIVVATAMKFASDFLFSA